MNERVTNQRMQATSGSWKRQGNRFLPRTSRQTQSSQHFDFRHTKLILGLSPPVLYLTVWLYDNNFVLFQDTNFVAICFSSNRKLIQFQSPTSTLPHFHLEAYSYQYLNIGLISHWASQIKSEMRDESFRTQSHKNLGAALCLIAQSCPGL